MLRGKAIQKRNGVFPIHVMKAELPYLEEHLKYFESKRKPGRGPAPDDTANPIRAAIEKIKASEDMPTLISIADYLNEDDVPPQRWAIVWGVTFF